MSESTIPPKRAKVGLLTAIAAVGAVIVISVVLTFVPLPSSHTTSSTSEEVQTSNSTPQPYVLVEVMKLYDTTYTTTVTTTPQLSPLVVIYHEVYVIVSGNQTYTVTTTSTSTTSV